MPSLEALLRPAASMINRQIAAKSPARQLCAGLAGRVMALRVSNTALAMYLVADENQVMLSAAYNEDPDVVITGSLLALTRLAGPDGDAMIRDGEVELIGDALVAQQFQKLLRYGRPDIEEELSGVVGDVAAHGIGEFIRSVGEWGRQARDTMRQNVGEYLQEESRSVPSRDEVDAFRGQVDALRDDVARFEARIGAIEARPESRENT
jgi:ubiquinone biosynthesis protein UbiJ